MLTSIENIVTGVFSDYAAGIDPTNNTRFFNHRDLNNFSVSGYQGMSTIPNSFGQIPIASDIIGPFNNSNPSSTPAPGLGPTDIYFVPYNP